MSQPCLQIPSKECLPAVLVWVWSQIFQSFCWFVLCHLPISEPLWFTHASEVQGSLIKSRDSQELAPYRWYQKSQGFQRWSVAVVAFLWPLLVFLPKLYLKVSLNSTAKARQCLCHHMYTCTAHFPSWWEILWLQGQLLCFPNVVGQWTQACTPAYRFP